MNNNKNILETENIKKEKFDDKDITNNDITKKNIKKAFAEIEKELKENSLTKEQLYEWFKEELIRKDTIIDKLKEDNKLLFNTVMRSNDKELDRMTKTNNNSNNDQNKNNTIEEN